jgi:hypothetical protein
MIGLECAKCKNSITDYSSMSQIIDEAGFTHTYCGECGKEVKDRINQRDSSIL